MALTVAEIMDTDAPSVETTDAVERVLEVLREHELPGVPWSTRAAAASASSPRRT